MVFLLRFCYNCEMNIYAKNLQEILDDMDTMQSTEWFRLDNDRAMPTHVSIDADGLVSTLWDVPLDADAIKAVTLVTWPLK